MGSRPVLPAPFDHPALTGAIALASGTLLALLMRGLPGGYALTGLTAVPYLLAASYLAPRIGVGLFLGALIAGQLGGGVVLDHFGVLGTATRPVDAIRVLGVVALLAGVVLVRGFR
jgi:transporter family-2 protein